MSDENSAKYDLFIKALEKLCLEHKVQIQASLYDLIEVHDLDERFGLSDLMYGFSDETKGFK